MRRILPAAVLVIAGAAVTASQVPPGDPSREWTHYAGTAASQKYSPLDQITAENVSRLRPAWRWTSPDNAIVEANPLVRPGMYHDTPLMIGGTLYTVTSLGQVAAIDAGTGQTRWVFDPESWKTGRPGNLGFVHRGLAYARVGDDERLLLGTGDAYLLSIDARRGQLDPQFGDGGKVDLMAGVPHAVRATNYAVSAAPIVCRGVIVVGSSIHDGPTQKEWPRGDVSGYDVRSGRRLWTLRSIPQKGDFGDARGSAIRPATPATPTCGRTCRRTRSSGSSTCRSARRPTISTAAIGRATTSSPRAWLRSMSRTGKRAWHFQMCTTASGTTTCPPRRSSPTSRWTGAPQGRRAGEQAGVLLRLRPADREAGLADRRAARAAVDDAGRADVADAAVPDSSRRPSSARASPTTI